MLKQENTMIKVAVHKTDMYINIRILKYNYIKYSINHGKYRPDM